jgi:transposase-like protein
MSSRTTTRIEVIGRVSGRRRWTVEQKLAILRDAFGPEGAVRTACERHEVGSGQLYTWRRQAMSGELTGIKTRALPAFAKVEVTGLTTRRAASGALIVERGATAAESMTVYKDVAEILVVGKRSQNVDFRRRENDVQPYQVATREQIVRAHRDNLDQFFRSRVTANAAIAPPSLLRTGQTNSQINLKILGAGQTLMLVDGRRLPLLPEGTLDFAQADISAIPLHAIDRVEMLTGSRAAGIAGTSNSSSLPSSATAPRAAVRACVRRTVQSGCRRS